jgi:hypothetical protein
MYSTAGSVRDWATGQSAIFRCERFQGGDSIWSTVAISIDYNQLRSAKLDSRHCVRIFLEPRHDLCAIGGRSLLPALHQGLLLPFAGLSIPGNPRRKYGDPRVSKLQSDSSVSGLNFPPERGGAFMAYAAPQQNAAHVWPIPSCRQEVC